MTASPDQVVTRFAPSPTGYLHIGGARTALFNFLFARHHGGSFRLRIEDTDQKRSTQAAIDAILQGLDWLDLQPDGEIIYQSARAERHAQVAAELLATGKAYRCFATPEELDAMRAEAKATGAPMKYNGLWRDRSDSDAPADTPFVVRIKAAQTGDCVIDDAVQGRVTVRNAELDDFVLLRSDGTPTYMLAVVVDDHDMGVTHCIRGDDHLNNAFRQLQIIRAMGWREPIYAHIPLIHGEDGAKLSKRHGALGVGEYASMGYLPCAMENYLLRLGWSHGDDELITRAQAIEWFELAGIGRSAARLDLAKLDSVNAHYMRTLPIRDLAQAVQPHLETAIGRRLGPAEAELLEKALPGLRERAKTLIELAQAARFYFATRPISIEPAAAQALTAEQHPMLHKLVGTLLELEDWTEATIDSAIKALLEELGLKFGQFGKPVRAALCGTMQAPGLAQVIWVLGKAESIARLQDVVGADGQPAAG